MQRRWKSLTISSLRHELRDALGSPFTRRCPRRLPSPHQAVGLGAMWSTVVHDVFEGSGLDTGPIILRLNLLHIHCRSRDYPWLPRLLFLTEQKPNNRMTTDYDAILYHSQWSFFICFLLFLFCVCDICPGSHGCSILGCRIGFLWRWFLQGSICRIVDYHTDDIVQDLV